MMRFPSSSACTRQCASKPCLRTFTKPLGACRRFRTQVGAQLESREGLDEPAARAEATDADGDASSRLTAGITATTTAPLGVLPSRVQELERNKRTFRRQAKSRTILGQVEQRVFSFADPAVGPALAALGVQEDPEEFYLDAVKITVALQLATCGVAYYAAQLNADLGPDEVVRCTFFLALGFLTHSFGRVDRVLWPAYQAAMHRLIEAVGVKLEEQFLPTGPSSAARGALLLRLGAVLACDFAIPQVLWGWDASTNLQQLVGPLTAGWALYPATVALGLAYKFKLQKSE